MRTLKYFFVLIAIGCAAPAPSRAAEIVRSALQIAAIPIRGVTLATPPKEAFDRLLAAGYRSGKVKTYADWKGRELAFERGGPGAPEGESWITLARHKGQLTQITEQANQPRKRFDAVAEIGAVQRHFKIKRDNRKCRADAHGAGHCRVQDTDKATDVDLVFGMQVLSITMNRYATRKKAYKESLR